MQEKHDFITNFEDARHALELNSLRQAVKTPPRLRNFSSVGNRPERLEDDIFQWLRRTTLFRATEPHDKFYGSLGLMRGAAWAVTEIDYDLHIDEVTYRFVSHLIFNRGSLEFMALCSETLIDRPSWLPNLLRDGLPWIGDIRAVRKWAKGCSRHTNCLDLAEPGSEFVLCLKNDQYERYNREQNKRYRRSDTEGNTTRIATIKSKVTWKSGGTT